MAEIASNPNKVELNNFKNEILANIREIEVKLNNQISNKELKLNKDYQEFTSKMNSLIDNNKEIVANIVSQQLKIEKIGELEQFKNKVDGMLITHEVRIKNNIGEIEKIKTKYDKIITDNLYVSGFIGNSCQFRNLSEYLSYNISEVSKLKIEREQYKKDMKDIRNKLDATMKNMITLNDNSVKLCNKYADNKQEQFRQLLEVTQSELNHKSLEIRAMIKQFNNETDLKIIDLKKEFNKLLEMKKEFNNYIDEKYINFQIKNDELNLNLKQSNENIDNNKKNIESAEKQIDNLDKKIKELHFLLRNYYFINNKLASLIEQLGVNPTKSEIAKLIYGIQGNTINIEVNRDLSAIPQSKKSHKNVGIFKMSLDPNKLLNFEPLNNTKNNNTSGILTPQKKTMLNRIGLKNVDNKNNIFKLDSENSIVISDESLKANENKNQAKHKENIKSNTNQKKYLKINNIKPNTNAQFKNNNKDNSIENNKEYIKEKNKEDNKFKNKEDNKKIKEEIKTIKENNKDNHKEDNKKTKKEDNKKDIKNINTKKDKDNNLGNTVKNNSINNLEFNLENTLKNKFIKEPYKEASKINSFRESINIQEEKHPNRKILSSNNQKDKNNRISNILQSLPLLTVGNKDKNYEENIKQNISSSNFENNYTENNKNVIVITNNNYSNKNTKYITKIDLELEKDKKRCKYVLLSLPRNPLEQPVINLTKKKKEINKNEKYAMVNSLINEFRAKFFTKAHSPKIKFDTTNEILDIPKKVTQAFGRTTYSFYYKKDVIDRAKANKNINNFGYNGPKSIYKFKNK